MAIKHYDEYTRAALSISPTHERIHTGKHFFSKGYIEVAGKNTEEYMLFKTPQFNTRVHAKAKFSAEKKFAVGICLDPIIADVGQPVKTFNNEMDSTIVPELKAWANPTVVSHDECFWNGIVGQSATGVSLQFGYEIMAKPEAYYLFIIKKLSAGKHYFDYDFWWYERIPKF